MSDIYNLYKTNKKMFVKSIIEKNDIEKLLICCDKSGNNFLHILIKKGDIESFKAIMCMIKKAQETNNSLVQKIINQQNKDGDTPAHIAVRKSKEKDNKFSIMVETLQSVGANFTIPNMKNQVIVKLAEPKYDSSNTEIKKYINNCLFGQSLDNNYEVSESPNPNYYAPRYLDDINTSSPVVLEVFVNKYDNPLKQTGGGKKDYESSTESSSDSEINGKRRINNPYISMKGGSKKSQQIHDEIINRIKEMQFTDEQAKDIKNVIYYEVKEKYPKLNNNERAEKMLDVIDKKLKNIDLDVIKKELEKYRERRNNNIEPKKSSKKESTKKSSKKESKRSNKSRK